MFEKRLPFADAGRDENCGDDLLVGSSDTLAVALPDSGLETGWAGPRPGEALRAIEWSELTARLNAARELRRELREEAMLCAGSSGARFGDAAAGFFNALDVSEPGVNPEDLEGRKASCSMVPQPSGAAATGDARDEL